jgi:sarcosine oxidase
MKTEFEYIVIGLGGLGSAAAYWLSRRAGGEVLGLEQFELGHVRGESQDHSRIIRLSYHTPGYVRLAQQAYAAWQTVEEDAGEKLIVKTGGLDLWPQNPAIPMSDYTESLTACNIPYEIWEAAEIRKRFPQFHIGDDVAGMYQSEGGIAPAAKCNAAHQSLARKNGAVLRENVALQSISESGGGLQVVTAETTYHCRKLIVAAGPWSNHLLAQFGLHLPLTITQEQVTYFASPDLRTFAPGRFPIWIWMDDPSFYGFPVYGEAGVKVGQDVGGQEVTPETRSFDPDPAALARVQTFLKRYIPGAVGPVLYTKTCLYTLTPDRDFVIDALPQQPDCLVTIGAGHAFKFASLIGKILSELAIDGKTSSDISPFKINRPILLQKNPPKNFMT